MRYVALIVAMMAAWPAVGQVPAGLSITIYRLAGEERRISATVSEYEYRADVVNTGEALSSLAATVVSAAPNVVVVQGALRFVNIPANGQITSVNTFTLRIDRIIPYDLGALQWTFSSVRLPVAQPGPNQTVARLATVSLNGGGSTNSAGGGTLTYSWAFAQRPVQSATTLVNSTTVNPTFVADFAGTYVVRLTVSNSAGSDSANVTISTGNSIPVANPGRNQSVGVTTLVQLDGSRSSDVNGDALTYAWILTSRPAGSTAALVRPNTVNPQFRVDRPGSYVVQLIVNDGRESSAAEFMTVSTFNTAPVANAGPPQAATLNGSVQLTGAGSTDVDGDPLTYLWSWNSVPAGSTALLSSTTAVNPAFTVDRPGTYVAQLVVNDGRLNSAPVTVTISTNTIQPPTANAGPDQAVRQGALVTLSASGTDPQSQPLTYLWSFTTRPQTSTATLSNPTAANPAFTADKPGLFVVQLITNNGYLSSAPAAVTITTTGTSPVANAGPNQNTTVGALVTLTGAGSADADGDSITYAWSFLSRPAGSTALLTGPTSVSPTFVADLLGTYVVQLIVNDFFNNSVPVTVTIAAANRGTTVLPAITTVDLGSQVPFAVSLSSAAPVGGVTISLTTSDATRLNFSSSSVFIAEGAATPAVAPQILGLLEGPVTIGATAYAYGSATQVITGVNRGALILPAAVTVGLGAQVPFPVTLSAPAQAGGVTVTLTTTDATRVNLSTATVIIAEGATTPVAQPQLTGLNLGGVTIGATAYAYTAASQTARTTGALSFTPPSLTFDDRAPGSLTLRLSGPAPLGGLTVNLTSTNTGVVTVPATVNFVAGATTANVVVTPVTPSGTSVVRASALPELAETTANVTLTFQDIILPANVTVAPAEQANFNIALANPAAAGTVVTLSVSDPAKATFTIQNVAFSAGQTQPTAQPRLNGLSGGAVTITATASGLNNAVTTALVTGTNAGAILLPAITSIAQGQVLPYPVSLTAVAPAGGRVINLASSAPGNVSITPASVTVPAGQTQASITPQITGGSLGTATITATATGVASVNRLIQVTVPLAPTASVGPNQTLNEDLLVTLTSSASDPQSLPLTYQWTLTRPVGSTAALSSATVASPTFVPEIAGTYVARLIVNNGYVSSAPVSVTITATVPLAPTAIAGPNQTLRQNSLVTLNGSGTDPQSLPLTYLWTLTAKPAGSATVLSSTTVANPALTPDRPGTYVAQLIVNNGYVPSAAAVVTITANVGAVPVANPGVNQNGSAGVLVSLSGAGSTDGDNDVLTYAWSFVSRPGASAASLTGATTVSPTFIPDQSGNYVVQLVVNDGISNSAPASVTITVANRGNVVLPVMALGLGTQAALPVALTTAAPAGGVTVLLTSSNPARLSIPVSVFVPAGATSPVVLPVISGLDLGTVTIGAAAVGYTPASQTARVTATISLSPSTVTFIDVGTRTLTLTLSGPAPAGGKAISLSSTDTAVATVPPTVTIAQNATTASVIVTGVAPGSATIRANGTELAETTASIIFSPPDIILPINLVVALGEQAQFPVTLNRPSLGTTFVELSSSDPTKVSLSLQNVIFTDGQTTPNSQPRVTGLTAGAVTVTAATVGLNSNRVSVRVGLGYSFASPSLAITGTETSMIALTLSGPAPQNGVEVTLTSNNPGVATVPPSVVFGANTTVVMVPVTAVTPGSTTILATSTNAGDATLNVTVTGAAGAGAIVLPSIGTLAQGQVLAFPVSLTAPAAAGGVTVTLTSNASGVLTIAPLTVNIPAGQTQATVVPQVTAAGGGTASITATAASYAAVSRTGQVTSVPAQVFVSSGSAQSASVNTAFAGALVVAVTNSGGSPVPGALVTFAAPVSGATGSFAGGVTTATTNGSGLASSAIFSANAVGGSYTVTATVAGVASPANFSLSNTVPAGGGGGGGGGGGANALSLSATTVGQNLQTLMTVTLPQMAPVGGQRITVVTGDPGMAIVAGRPTDPGAGQLIFNVGEGLTSAGFYVQGMSGSGTVALTASSPGLGNGTGLVTLAPSGFVLTGPNGASNQSFTLGLGSSATLTVSAARLNSGLGFVESQALRGGLSVNVPLSNTGGLFGSVTGTTIASGASTATATFSANGISTGLAVLTAEVPAGFSRPALGADTVAATVTSATMITSAVIVGENLQTTTNIRLNSPAPAAGIVVTITSNDPGKVLFATSATVAGASSITMTIPAGRTASADFYVQGLTNSGVVAFSATAAGFGNVFGNVTLTRSGFVIAGPFGTGTDFFTTTGADPTNLTVTATRLDSTFSSIEPQQVRGGLTVDVDTTNSTPATGSVLGGPVRFTGGVLSATAQFQPLGAGTALVGVTAPTGFTPAANGASLLVTVRVPGLVITNGITIGYNLQAPGTLLLGQAAPLGGVQVTISSNSPDLLLATSATAAGTNSIVLTIPAGQTSGSYYLQSRASSGSPTYTASAAGFQVRTATVEMAPSGVTITGPFGPGFPFALTVAGGTRPATVAIGLLDPANNTFVVPQSLSGGLSLVVTLNNSNVNAATLASQVTIAGGIAVVDVPVQPVSAGSTLISIPLPVGYTQPRTLTSLTVSVSAN